MQSFKCLIFVTYFQELCCKSLTFFSELDHPELQDRNIHVKLEMCFKWHDVGLASNIAERKLREIDVNGPSDVSKCCREMFSH